MSITLALGAAMSGLAVAQQGLDATSHNITNVNTVGYTRKVFTQESQVLAGKGVGVRAGDLSRTVDESLLSDIRREAARAGDFSVKNTYYGRIQDLFGTPSDNSSIAHTIANLGTQFEALGLDVTKSTAALNAVQSAQDVTDQLSRMSEYIQSLRLEADRGIESDSQRATSLLSTIDTLNAEIVRNQNTMLDTGDLKDQRDNALTELSGIMNITYFTRDSGEVIVLTGTGRSLLDKEPVTISHQAVTQSGAGLSYESGNFNAVSAGSYDITNDITSGSIAGYVEMRDQILPSMQSELDQLASQMKDALNAAHNRGSSYPELAQSFNGSRSFIDPANQTVNLGAGDVRMVLYNADGTQAATSTMKTELGGSSGSVDDVATALNSFFSSYKGSAVNWASVDSDGHLNIAIPQTENVGFAMRDEDASGNPADITVNFDGNDSGDGIYEESVKGFSNFFGLNDFFVNDTANYRYDTKIVSSGAKMGTTSGMQIGIAGNTNVATVAIGPQDTVSSIAAKINSNSALAAANITASVVNEGSGVRLRILQNDGKEMQISETTSQGVLAKLGLAPSEAGTAEAMTVRDDLLKDPTLLSRGLLQYNADTGQYLLANGDNTVANQMAALFSASSTFAEAGKISTGTQSFAEYAANILSQSSSEASTVSSQSQTQQSLVDSLNLKQGQISGVNLDEEMSQLMIYQQAYIASARVITTTQTLFDVLNNIVK